MTTSQKNFEYFRKTPQFSNGAQYGRNIVALRKKRQLTQKQLAEKMGISLRYLQSIEAGKRLPAFPTLSKLKKALRATWNQLLENC